MNRTDKKTVGVMAIAEKAIQLHLHQRHNAVHYIFQIAPQRELQEPLRFALVKMARAGTLTGTEMVLDANDVTQHKPGA